MQSKNLILIIVLLTVPLGGVGIDLYASSLPALAAYFSADSVMVKSTLSTFLIGLFIGMLYAGIVSDTVGRKKPQLIHALLFALSSILIPFSHRIHTVLMLRFLQGLSAGGLQSVSRSILADAFAPEELTRKSLYVTSVWGMGPIIAPWLGGILMTYFGWKSCFYLFGAYGVMLAILITLFLPETHSRRVQFHWQNVLSEACQIIQHTDFSMPVLAMGMAYAILVSYGAIGPYFTQITLGLTPTEYGTIGLIVGCGYLVGNLVLRIQLGRQRAEGKMLTFAGLFALAINVISLLLQIIYANEKIIWISNVLASCFLMGFVYPIYMARSLRLHPARSGLASALTVSAVLMFASLFGVFSSMITIHSAGQFLLVYLVLSAGIMLIRGYEIVTVGRA